ncbi:MAG: hypothetical protein JKX84_03070 [Flavobacteriales bacterium]|nr:hypothetical protein [Flavobacteriales bacterium]
MSKGEQLFELVQSLELNEKRYYKLHASLQKKESNLARLFDYYAETSAFNEDRLRKRFKGEKFLDQLAVTQNHLYDSVLKSMRLYHMKRSIEFRLNGMLQDVRFLYDKGLVGTSERMLRKVRKVAIKNDCFSIILNVLEWESKLLADGFYVGKEESDIDEVSEEYYEVLGKLQNEREYADLQSKIFNNYYKIGVERGNTDYKTNDQIVNQFALKDPKRALTFRSKCCYLNIHSQYHKINGNWEKAYLFRKQLLVLVEEKFGSSYSKDAVKRYFVALNNLIPICMHMGRLSEVEEILDKMEAIEKQSLKSHFSEELKDRIFLQSSIGRLALYTRLGTRLKGSDVVRAVEQQIGRFKEHHRKFVILHLYYNLSYFLFSIGEYSQALKWLNMILNDRGMNSLEDLHSSTRLLTMILHFELGRRDFLAYLARTTKRYLVKLETVYQFEVIMLEFMKKFSQNNLDGNDSDVFELLKKNLISVKYEPGERNALSTLDLISWVDSKIEEKPLNEVLKSKHSV